MQLSDMVALRRRIHAHAEPGFLEFHTASLVMDTLDDLGVRYLCGAEAMDVEAILEKPSDEEYEAWSERAIEAGVSKERVQFLRDQGTAIIAVLRGNRPGPVWGIRCDIDALPIDETKDRDHFPNQEGFRSQTPYMHACGHDGHTVMGLALASRLADGDFPGEVRLLFQPAEEGVRGAIPMIAAGAVSDVEIMLAIHNQANQPLGTVVGGIVNHKATTKWRATFSGEPAHAAGAPEKGRNALAAAAQASLGILGLPRYSTTDTRVNVGTFQAGGSANIIPADATITYEVRSEDNDVVADMDSRVESLVRGAAQMYGVDVATNVYGRSVNTRPDDAVIERISSTVKTLPWVTDYSPTARPTAGSDDAHLFIHEVQKAGGTGAYMRIGAYQADAPAHHHSYDFHEEALSHGTDLLEAVVRQEP